MYEQDRQAVVRKRVCDRHRPKVRAGQFAEAPADERQDRESGQTILFSEQIGEDIARRGVAAVGDDAAHARRQTRVCGKENGGGAHGNAVENDLHVPAEAAVEFVCKVADIPPLVHALVDHQDRIAASDIVGERGGEIVAGAAAVAVDKEHHAAAAAVWQKDPVQFQPVKRGDINLLFFKLVIEVAPRVDLGFVRFDRFFKAAESRRKRDAAHRDHFRKFAHDQSKAKGENSQNNRRDHGVKNIQFGRHSLHSQNSFLFTDYHIFPPLAIERLYFCRGGYYNKDTLRRKG